MLSLTEATSIPGVFFNSVSRCSAKRARGFRIGILAGRHSDSPNPEILRVETGFLLTQPDEAGDEQTRAGQKHDTETDLGRDQAATKALLPRAAGHGAAAILQAVDQISARTLPCRIKSHDQPSESESPMVKSRIGRFNSTAPLSGKTIGGESRNDRDNPKREAQADRAQRSH